MGKKFAFFIAAISAIMLSDVRGQDCSDVNAVVLIADDSTRCVGESTQLRLLGLSGTISWTWFRSVSGADVWIPVGSEETFTDTPTENMDYRVRITNSFPECTDTTTVVTIQVSDFAQVPAPGFGGDECGTQLFPVASTSSMPIEFWSSASDTSNVVFYPDVNQPQPDSAVVDKYGLYKLVWNISDGICTKTDTVQFKALQQPIADAGGDADMCGTTFQLNAQLSVPGGSGEWFKVSAGVFNFEDYTNPNTNVSANIGTHTLRWTERNTPTCQDDVTISVRVAAQPIADAGVGGDECDTTFALNATLSNGSGFWELISDSRTVDFSNQGLPNSNVYVEEYGENYIFQWKEINSFCSDSDTVVVNFFEQPVSSAIPNENTCGRGADLTALPSAGTGTWTYFSGPVSPESLTQVNDSVSSVIIVEGQYESHTFQWKEINGRCSDSTQISFRFIEQPLADGGSGGEVCDHNFLLNAEASVGTGEWLVVDSIGSVSFLQGRNASNSVIQIQDYGLYTFQWKEVNEVCSDTSDILTVIFNEQPSVTPFTDRYSCGFNFALTTDYSVEGASGNWEGSATFNTDHDSVLWVCTVNNSGSYRFLWTETNGDCSDTASILVNYIEQPDADIITLDSISCSSEINLIADNSVGTGQWEMISGPGTLSFNPDESLTDIIATSDVYGDYQVRWTLMNELCVDSDSLHISFVENPTVNAGPDQNLDNEFETSMQAELPTYMTGEWYLVSGTGDFNDPYSPESSVYNLSLGENVFNWVVANGACESNDSVSIFIFDIFIPDLLSPNGDNDNDYFEIVGIENIENVEVTVFNRWGVEVFQSDNYQNDWDGTGKSGEYLTNDTYFYVVNINNEQRVFKGFVMLNK